MPNQFESLFTQFSEFELRQMITEANQAMEQKGHAQVFFLAQSLLNYDVLRLVEEINHNEKPEINRHDLLLSIAALGMLRIVHVDINKQLKEVISDDLRTELIINIQAIQKFYQSLTFQALPSFTIHENPINWFAETAQDLGNTHKILDNLTEAIETLWRAIEKNRKMDSEQLHKKAQKDIDMLEFFDVNPQRILDANKSSQAVCEMRLGTMIDDLGLLYVALLHQWQTMNTPNVDRLIDMHLITLKYLTQHKQKLVNILPTIGIGLSTLFTFITHPKTFIERARLHAPKR